MELVLQQMFKSITGSNDEETNLTGYEEPVGQSALPASDLSNEDSESSTKEYPTDMEGDNEGHQDFERLIRVFTLARRVFRTDRGYLGNGPVAQEIGDQVWILAGAKVPFILRPLNSGRWKVIGDVYVHGLMQGEAMERFSRGLMRELQLE